MCSERISRRFFSFEGIVAATAAALLVTGCVEQPTSPLESGDPSFSHAAGHCTVTSLGDDGAGTLRALIADASCATIDFDPGLLPGVITLTSGQLDIARDVVIDGPGADRLAVSGNDASRVFFVHSGTVDLEGLTIRDAVASGIYPANRGGGLTNLGTTTVTNSVVTGNSADSGGGIFNWFGSLKIEGTTISGNSADHGGGVVSIRGTLLTIHSSTISGNTARNGAGLVNQGTAAVVNSTVSGNSATQFSGGIENLGVVTLDHVTVTANTAPQAGGIYSAGLGSTVNLVGTIIAGNTASKGPDCYTQSKGPPGVPLSSQGYNLIGNTADCDIPAADPTDLLNVDPMLGPLGGNGGPTATHALDVNSPAIDHIPTADCAAATDQRGMARPKANGCDIGAFESALTPPPNQSPAVTAASDSVSTDEGTVATNTGTLVDPDGDEMTLSASEGTVVDNRDGTWSWSNPANGPAGYRVTVTADDGNGGTAYATFKVTVNNVAPTIVSVTNDGPVAFGAPATITVSATDPAGIWGPHLAYSYDCDNDGTHEGGLRDTDSVQCIFDTPGDHTVDVGVYDLEGSHATSSTVVTMLAPTIEDVIGAANAAVANGTLAGDGPGRSAAGRLRAWRNMLDAARSALDEGSVRGACNQLREVYLRADGTHLPPDFVSGAAAADVAAMIQYVREDLGCRPV